MHIETLKKLATQALENLKAKDIVLLDVQAVSCVTDFLLIASGTSTRQVAALAQNLVTELKSAGFQPLGVEGMESAEWVLVDCGDLVVHLMLPQTRAFYDLEKLWGDFASLSHQA